MSTIEEWCELMDLIIVTHQTDIDKETKDRAIRQ